MLTRKPRLASAGLVAVAMLQFLAASQADLTPGTAASYTITAEEDFVATELLISSVKDTDVDAFGSLQGLGITALKYSGINFLVSATASSPFPAEQFNAAHGGAPLMRDGYGLLIKSGSTLTVTLNDYANLTIHDAISVGVAGYNAAGSPVPGSNSPMHARKLAAAPVTAIAAAATGTPQILSSGSYKCERIWLSAEDSSAPGAGTSQARGTVLKGCNVTGIAYGSMDHVIAGAVPADYWRDGRNIGPVPISGAVGPTFSVVNANTEAVYLLAGAEVV